MIPLVEQHRSELDGIVWGNIQLELPGLLQTVVRLLQLPDTTSS